MALLTPTTAQIRAQVAALRERMPEARAVAIHSPGGWNGREELTVAGEALTVRVCQSALEVREALLTTEAGGPGVVIITPLSDGDLEADVRARLARGRLLQVRAWDIVRDVMKLRDMDPRLTDEPWMAETLLEAYADNPARAIASGFLDLDTAWDLVAERLGLASGRPDVLELLRWAQQGGLPRYRQAPQSLRTALRQRVADTGGTAGETVIDCLAGGSADQVLPLGLVCSVVFCPDLPQEAHIVMERASVRLERYCGDRHVVPMAGQAWAQAAEAVIEDILQKQGLNDARGWLQEADSLLRDVGASEFAWLGRFSLLGLEQRLTRFAAALSEATELATPSVTTALVAASAAAREHGMASEQRERIERVEMGVRLVRWLGSAASSPEPRSFEEAAGSYVADTGFTDWVRSELEGGDPCAQLSAAYSGLLTRVSELRERENERFGRLLSEWTAAGSAPREALLVEELLASLVGPIAEDEPVLLLVIDGMTVAVFRKLAQDLAREGWAELVQEGRSPARPLIAALPTVTEVSRASLLCGRLCTGLQADEKSGFESHPELLKRTGRRKPPVLFHKADLGEAGETGLAAAVRSELVDRERKIVGLVVNAVDDHLAKGDQIRPHWSIEAIRPLRSILHAAQQAERIVVIAADHGHITEQGTALRSHPDAERWRADDGAPGPDEVILSGPRVMKPAQGRLIAPWSEQIRYGMRKNGYHGGASPQEVVVPLGVYSAGVELPGWTEAPPVFPTWWSDEALGEKVAPVQRPAPGRRKTRKAEGQPDLFGAAAAPDRLPSGWLDSLLKSSTWKAQIQSAGRLAIDPDRMRRALEALDERGGKLTRMALAQRLGIPPARLPGFLAALRRVLNVDGYGVVEVDEAADAVTLNRDLLKKQFELPGA